MSQIETKFIEDGAVDDSKISAGVDATKIGAGTVDNTEFGYLDGVTSAIQTQFSGKVPTSRNINTASNSGLAGGGDLSADRSLVVNPDNAPSVAVASGDEILFADVSNSNALAKTTAGAIAALVTGSSNSKETFVLSGADITNQYVDLSQVAKTGSINFLVKNGGAMLEGASYDYTVSYTGGAGGKTRISFVNDLATGGASALVAADVLQVQYEY